MTENKEEYPKYLKDLSDLRVTMLSLLSGFTFTTITLFLNRLPDPNRVMSQVILLFLAVMFEIFLFLLGWQITITMGMWSNFKITSPPPRASRLIGKSTPLFRSANNYRVNPQV